MYWPSYLFENVKQKLGLGVKEAWERFKESKLQSFATSYPQNSQETKHCIPKEITHRLQPFFDHDLNTLVGEVMQAFLVKHDTYQVWQQCFHTQKINETLQWTYSEPAQNMCSVMVRLLGRSTPGTFWATAWNFPQHLLLVTVGIVTFCKTCEGFPKASTKPQPATSPRVVPTLSWKKCH